MPLPRATHDPCLVVNNVQYLDPALDHVLVARKAAGWRTQTRRPVVVVADTWAGEVSAADARRLLCAQPRQLIGGRLGLGSVWWW